LQFAFVDYLNFLETREFRAKVVNQYKKKNYFVLKLKGDFEFYTTSRDYLKNLLNETITFRFVKRPSFLEYLGIFYAPTFDLRLVPISKIEYFI
jgi:competence protein ComEC